MGGRNQHEIPRLYQRGFLIPDTGDRERIFQFRRGGRIFPRNIAKVAYEKDFYATPDPAGARTLDDDITEYEGRIGQLVSELRALPSGALAPPATVAEVVMHLAFRSAHLRDTFKVGATSMVGLVDGIIRDDELIMRLLELDGPTGLKNFKAKIFDRIANDPRANDFGFPRPILERLIFARLREQFSNIMDEQRPLMLAAFKSIAGEIDHLAKDAHNKALSKPRDDASPRETWLRSLTWRVVGCPEDVVLPDCIAIGVDAEGLPQSVVTAAVVDVREVYVPLTSKTLLVGLHTDAQQTFDHANFNAAAAASSHTYFLCASQLPETAALVGLIGAGSTATIDKMVAEGPRGFVDRQARQPKPEGVFGRALASDDWNFPVTISGDFAPDAGEKVVAAMNAIICNAAWDLPLSKVAAVTFADDYIASLAQISSKEQEPTTVATLPNAGGEEAGQLLHIMKDGHDKCHLVFHGAIGRALVSDDEKAWEQAATVVANLFARAGFSAIYEVTFDREWNRRQLRPIDGEMHAVMRDACKAYLASRASAVFASTSLEIAQQLAGDAFQSAVDGIDVARDAVALTEDYGAFWHTAAHLVKSLMSTIGMLLGSAHAAHADPLEGADSFAAMLTERGLNAWFTDVQRDLDHLWKRRGVWESYDELLSLDRHAERVLWAMGIFLWEVDNEIRVQFLPAGADVAFAASWTELGFL